MRASSKAVCLSSSSTPAWVGAMGGLEYSGGAAEYSAGALAPSAALLSACNVQATSRHGGVLLHLVSCICRVAVFYLVLQCVAV
mmetsp:Transcript_4248/g.6861  ORF Transcript_4248/g.6861 Transcript_4248/m.6861 type:complete len:84 (-) Transcript_4248:13-264(-)